MLFYGFWTVSVLETAAWEGYTTPHIVCPSPPAAVFGSGTVQKP